MSVSFERWLIENSVLLQGGDDDDTDVDDEEDDLEDDGSDGASDGDDLGDDDDDSSDGLDLAAELKKVRREAKKTKRELQAALELLDEASAYEGNDDEDPEVSELREDNAKMRKLLAGAYIKSKLEEFTDDKGNKRWTWEDKDVVFALLDKSELEVDVEDGTIDGLEEQLEELAKKKPFLLKKTQRPNKPSGKAPGGTSSNKKNKTTEDWAKDFPVFNTFG